MEELDCQIKKVGRFFFFPSHTCMDHSYVSGIVLGVWDLSVNKAKIPAPPKQKPNQNKKNPKPKKPQKVGFELVAVGSLWRCLSRGTL